MGYRLIEFALFAPGYHPRVCPPDHISCLPERDFNYTAEGTPNDTLYLEYRIVTNCNPVVRFCSDMEAVNTIRRSFNMSQTSGVVRDDMPLCFCPDGERRNNQEIIIQVDAFTQSHPLNRISITFRVTFC